MNVPLSLVGNNVYFYTRRLHADVVREMLCDENCWAYPLRASARYCCVLQPAVHYLLQVAFQALTKVLEHRRTTGKNNVLGVIIFSAKVVQMIIEMFKPYTSHDEHR